MTHIADWNTGEDYRVFKNEKEAIDWVKKIAQQRTESLGTITKQRFIWGIE